jgi:uncharacterized membrane protein YozB (DUF420 family)
MPKLHDLPTLNAILNSISAVLIVTGYCLIRARRIEAHRKVMLAAFTSSTLFLASYLVYHAQVGSVHFRGTGAIRTVYFTILITHTLLAAVVAPMVIVTLFRGLKGRFPSHRKLARVTLPIWLYVSVTGVVVYAMLYHL